MQKVKCNKCGWSGFEEDLKFLQHDTAGNDCEHACPVCDTDAYLIDQMQTK